MLQIKRSKKNVNKCNIIAELYCSQKDVNADVITSTPTNTSQIDKIYAENDTINGIDGVPTNAYCSNTIIDCINDKKK